MFSTWIGVVLLFAFFGLLALVVIGASPRGDTYEEKRAKARTEKLQAVREETTKALTTYAWVDKNKGVVRIPINDAMKLTVAELAQKTPVAANPIAPEASPAAPAPSSPPASASQSPSSIATPSPNSVPQTQPGPSTTPPSSAAKASMSPSASPSPSAPATPSPVHGKTP